MSKSWSDITRERMKEKERLEHIAKPVWTPVKSIPMAYDFGEDASKEFVKYMEKVLADETSLKHVAPTPDYSGISFEDYERKIAAAGLESSSPLPPGSYTIGGASPSSGRYWYSDTTSVTELKDKYDEYAFEQDSYILSKLEKNGGALMTNGVARIYHIIHESDLGWHRPETRTEVLTNYWYHKSGMYFKEFSSLSSFVQAMKPFNRTQYSVQPPRSDTPAVEEPQINVEFFEVILDD